MYKLLCSFLLASGLLCGAAPLASAAALAPLCAAPAALDAPRVCVVAATFPDVDYQVCFDPSGPAPEVCTAREAAIPVAADGTFELDGKHYAGAPAGTAFVAAVKLTLPDNAQVTCRATRPNGQAIAADIFQAPPAAQPVAPKVFAPTEAPAAPPAE